MTSNTKKYISIASLSERWDRGRQTIWRACNNGTFPAKRIGRLWYLPMSWVLDQEAEIDDQEGGVKEKTLVN